ncbi:MAG: hypothetical protein F4056_04720 [Chloroflexi bacterium]|nr:hypothetical protein [Chloroflexota bacterium]
MVDREALSELAELRTAFRYRSGLYGESKGGNVNHPKFREALDCLDPLLTGKSAVVAASVITKARYHGPWLHPDDDVPADPNFLRNYMVRKTLELAFDGDAYTGGAFELVLDRVDYSDEQVLNLRQYLRGDFAEHGPFPFPRVTHVTHGDSVYIDGLQVADHFARLAYAVASGSVQPESLDIARRFMRVATVVAGRSFTLSADAYNALSRRTQLGSKP